MLFVCDLRGDKNAEVADLFMHHVNDALAADADFPDIGIGICNPVKRLLWRCDVVTVAREHDDRRPNRLEVNRTARFEPSLVLGQAVADKKLFNDPANLGFVHQKEATPPGFKFQKGLVAPIDITKQIGIFSEQGSRWIEQFKVLNQMSSIKLPASKIRKYHRNPGAPKHAGVVAHRVFAYLTRPRRDGRPIDHDRTAQVAVAGR